jgi:hypothetical protein
VQNDFYSTGLKSQDASTTGIRGFLAARTAQPFNQRVFPEGNLPSDYQKPDAKPAGENFRFRSNSPADTFAQNRPEF